MPRGGHPDSIIGYNESVPLPCLLELDTYGALALTGKGIFDGVRDQLIDNQATWNSCTMTRDADSRSMSHLIRSGSGFMKEIMSEMSFFR